MNFIPQTLETGEDLLHCLRVSLGTSPAENLVLPPDRWMRVADLAAKAQLAPLLFKSLPLGRETMGIPKDVLSGWFRAYLVSASRNNNLKKHLDRILQSFEKEGIPAILLKGVHLMDSLYAERAMRTVGDIDLLIQPGDTNKATRAMLDLGYEARSSLPGVPINHPCHHMFRNQTDDAHVEIHFRLLDPDGPIRLDISEVWSRSQAIGDNGHQAKALGNEDLIIYLCVHLTNHLLSWGLFPPLLRSLYDVALLVHRQHDAIAWEDVFQTLHSIHAEREFRVAVSLIQSLFDIRMPAPVADYMLTAILPSDAEMLKQHILLSCEKERMEDCMPGFARSSIMEKRQHMVSRLLRRIIPTRASIERRYGSQPNRQATLSWYILHSQYLFRLVIHPWSFIIQRLNFKARYRYIMDKCFHPNKRESYQDREALEQHLKHLSAFKARIDP